MQIYYFSAYFNLETNLLIKNINNLIINQIINYLCNK
jgi:hypothetical protein